MRHDLIAALNRRAHYGRPWWARRVGLAEYQQRLGRRRYREFLPSLRTSEPPDKNFLHSLSKRLDSTENKLLTQEYQRFVQTPCSARNRESCAFASELTDLISQSPPNGNNHQTPCAMLSRAIKMICSGALRRSIKYTT
jgi:hypothetical protein